MEELGKAIEMPCKPSIKRSPVCAAYDVKCETCGMVGPRIGAAVGEENVREIAVDLLAKQCPSVAALYKKEIEALREAAAKAEAEAEAMQAAEKADLQGGSFDVPAGGSIKIESLDGGGFRVTQVMEGEAGDGVGESQENEAES